MNTLIELMDTFEEGVAKATLRSRSQIAGHLRSIENAAVTVSNQGRLPPGTKSIALRIRKLSADIRHGLESKELSAKEFRDVVKNKLGQLNTAFKQSISGKLSSAGKEQVREEHESQDTWPLIEKIVQEHGYDQSSGVVRGRHHYSGEHLNAMMEKMLSSFTLQELRTMDMGIFESVTVDDLIEGDKHGFGHIKRNLFHKSDEEYRQLSESYKHLNKLLPRHVDVATAISYPVIPVFNDIDAIKNPHKLENAGFDVTRVGDHFLVLENQFLLCLNTEELDFGKALKVSRDKTKLRSVKGKAAQQAEDQTSSAVLDFLEQINMRSKVKYVLASDTIVRNPLNHKIALIWLIPEKSRHVLDQTLRTRKVDWDIPRHELTTHE